MNTLKRTVRRISAAKTGHKYLAEAWNEWSDGSVKFMGVRQIDIDQTNVRLRTGGSPWEEKVPGTFGWFRCEAPAWAGDPAKNKVEPDVPRLEELGPEAKTFYCNEPCRVIAYLDEHEALIHIAVGTYCVSSGDAYEPPSYEPDIRSIVVNRKYLTTSRIDIDAQFKLLDQRMKSVDDEIASRRRRAEMKLQELENQVLTKLKRYEGITTLVDIADGKLKWALVKARYSSGHSIVPIDTLLTPEKKLRALVVRHEWTDKPIKTIKFVVDLAEYSDGSGSIDEFWAFETEQEAVAAFVKTMSGSSSPAVGYRDVELAAKYQLSIPSIEAERLKRAGANKKTLERRVEVARMELQVAEKALADASNE